LQKERVEVNAPDSAAGGEAKPKVGEPENMKGAEDGFPGSDY
jgi:hypothetical protein